MCACEERAGRYTAHSHIGLSCPGGSSQRPGGVPSPAGSPT